MFGWLRLMARLNAKDHSPDDTPSSGALVLGVVWASAGQFQRYQDRAANDQFIASLFILALACAISCAKLAALRALSRKLCQPACRPADHPESRATLGLTLVSTA